MSVIAAVIASVLALLCTAVAAGGVVSAGRGRAVAAADAAALAAAPVTFRPFGATGSPGDEAERLAKEHGATVVRCVCSPDPSWSSRVVEVEVTVTIEMLGTHTVSAVSRAEFDPVRLLMPTYPRPPWQPTSPRRLGRSTGPPSSTGFIPIGSRMTQAPQHRPTARWSPPGSGSILVGSSRRWWRWSTGLPWWRSSPWPVSST